MLHKSCVIYSTYILHPYIRFCQITTVHDDECDNHHTRLCNNTAQIDSKNVLTCACIYVTQPLLVAIYIFRLLVKFLNQLKQR